MNNKKSELRVFTESMESESNDFMRLLNKEKLEYWEGDFKDLDYYIENKIFVLKGLNVLKYHDHLTLNSGFIIKLDKNKSSNFNYEYYLIRLINSYELSSVIGLTKEDEAWNTKTLLNKSIEQNKCFAFASKEELHDLFNLIKK